MNIYKPTKITIGVLTILAVLFPFVIAPTFYMFIVFIFGFPFFDPRSAPNPYDFEKTLFPVMMVFVSSMLCFSLVQLGLQVFHIVHEIKNKALTDTFRILFAIGTFFLPYISMPIYFFAYLWRDRPQEVKTPQPEAIS